MLFGATFAAEPAVAPPVVQSSGGYQSGFYTGPSASASSAAPAAAASVAAAPAPVAAAAAAAAPATPESKSFFGGAFTAEPAQALSFFDTNGDGQVRECVGWD